MSLQLSTPLLVAGGVGAYVLTQKGKGGGKLGSVKKVLNIEKGPLAKPIKGLGTGTLVNIADKKFLGGRLTAIGVPLGKTLNGKPLNINATDVLTYFITTGGLKVSKKDLISGIVTVGVKKVGEAFDWIDPPLLPVSNSAGVAQYSFGFSGPAPSVKTVSS